MSADLTAELLGKLADLRVELTEQAFDLERQGSVAAADVAMIMTARLGELCDEVREKLHQSTVRPLAVGSSE